MEKKVRKRKRVIKKPTTDFSGTRLNKYLANAGVSSRRKADELIAAGKITVNGKVITEMGFRVLKNDKVEFDGKEIKPQKRYYILLNKPKDFITTTKDEKDRKTVMDLVKKACEGERIYPVGRLDRNTTGLLLITNDGELAHKLTHPSKKVKKIYQAKLNKPLTKAHFTEIHRGIELEDGFIKVDRLAWPDQKEKDVVGIELHSGKNRIVRRIFESLGYKVLKLDRVVFGSLTKKDLPRGKWRHLDDKEIIRLKHLN